MAMYRPNHKPRQNELSALLALSNPLKLALINQAIRRTKQKQYPDPWA